MRHLKGNLAIVDEYKEIHKQKQINGYWNELKKVLSQSEGEKDPSTLLMCNPFRDIEKLAIKRPERKKVFPPIKVVKEELETCYIHRKKMVIANGLPKKLKKYEAEKQDHSVSYNLLLKEMVAQDPSKRIEYEELCRLIFGIPFEYGEGYTYQSLLLKDLGTINTVVFDYLQNMKILGKSNIPRKFVEYRENKEGYLTPVVPKKCQNCESFEIYEVDSGRRTKNGEIIGVPRFRCSCEDVVDAPSHDCMPDIAGLYAIPVENLTPHKTEKKRAPKAAWIQKIKKKMTYQEASGLNEDLEIIAPGDKEAKKLLLEKMTSIEICFMAFELKRLEPEKQVFEPYSEVYTNPSEEFEDNEAYMFLESFDFEDTEENSGPAEKVCEEFLHADYEIEGENGIAHFYYIYPHEESNIKSRGFFDGCGTCQEMIDFAKKISWKIIDWEEYYERKRDLITQSRIKMSSMIDWIKKNPKKGKIRVIDITYNGAETKIPLNSDDIHLLWQAVRGKI